MTWFFFALGALLLWSGSDLFSKLGCQSETDRYSHLKMVMAVGLIMGLHAAFEVFVGGTVLNGQILLTYLPVSLLYILSMAIGYLGLRYIELSISSPICNSSGAIVAALTAVTVGVKNTSRWQLAALILTCIGVFALGVVQMTEDDELRRLRQEKSNRKYTKSAIALILPLVYCLLDALGTFADSIVLETLNEDSANAAYELTFFFAGLVCAVYVLIVKKQKLLPKAEAPKYLGAVFETAGQFCYIYALADRSHVMYSAPIISSYCAVSVLWSRIFLKEKLSWKHYAAIAVTMTGIVVLGLFEEL